MRRTSAEPQVTGRDALHHVGVHVEVGVDRATSSILERVDQPIRGGVGLLDRHAALGRWVMSALSISTPASASATRRDQIRGLGDDLVHIVVERDVLGPGVDRGHQVLFVIAGGVDDDHPALIEQVATDPARPGCRRA